MIALADSMQAVRWRAPDLDTVASPNQAPEISEPAPALPSVEDLQALEAAAREEGYASGHAAGHAAGLATGQSEVRRMIAQMEGILDGFTRPLARLDDEVADALGELAVRIAGNLLGRTYQADPTLLADLVREALDAVGTSSREIELRLHSESVRIDGTLASRLQACLDAAMDADANDGGRP